MQNVPRAVPFLLALLLAPSGLGAQLMPGGRTVDVGRLRGDFYGEMAVKVREVMEAWQAVWRKVGEDSLQDLYSRGATILQPGGVPLRGRSEIRDLSQAVSPLTSALRTGMGDLEACEGFAYLSGYYAVDPSTAERIPSTGRHFTVIQQEGGDWLIRFQFFQPDSGTAEAPALPSPDLLEPLTNADLRAGPRGPSRFAAFGDAQYVLMAFRDAWKRGDAADAASFFSEEARVQLPHESGDRTGMIPLEERLREGMERFGEILSVELDFDRRDRLSFTFGRYHAVGAGAPDKPGHFFMLLKNAGNGWFIRTLIFS